MTDTLDYILKKYNITYNNEYVIEIPNIGREDMAKLFHELNLKKGVEVGVFKGKFSEVLCRENPQAIIAGVDAWKLDAHPKGVFVNGEEQAFFDKCFNETVERMQPYANQYTIVKKYSMDAVKDFEDESLDFVYIDAGHDFMSFTEDLHWWLKKVKVGGVMSGHDWSFYPSDKMIHVKHVLLGYMKSYHMFPFFVAGADEKLPGTIRDRWRSWFWVKDKHYA